MTQMKQEAISLLKDLIAIPSYSKAENKTADLLEEFMQSKGLHPLKVQNNVWVKNKHFDELKPTLLLASHHDTVKPNAGYSRDPFEPKLDDGKLFGLGSNDAGASLVALLVAFLQFENRKDLPFNLIYLACAEEEISGKNGVELALNYLPNIDCAIIGEPTEMNLAIAEKGLLVVDAIARGKASHAAHENAENSIYKAMRDIQWLSTFSFPRASEFLGKVKVTVTQISGGDLHNQVPVETRFTIDVRVPETYTLQEVFSILDRGTESFLQARSMRLNPSKMDPNHPLVQAGKEMGMRVYGSPTLSDQALMPFPSVKLGPGKSDRSHIADEYIEIKELEEGIEKYIELIEKYGNYEIVG